MNYISIQEIMWKLLRNPLLKSLTIEDAATTAYSLIRLLKIPTTLNTVVVNRQVVDYKVRLPENMIQVMGVRRVDLVSPREGITKPISLKYGANPYHSVDDKYVKGQHFRKDFNEHSYILQNCNIITSFEKGEIEVSYQEMAVDSDGYPLIPDNESFIKAVEYSIMEDFAEPLWMMGKMTDKAFQRIEQQRLWYVGQASSMTTKMINYDQMDMVMKGVNQLIVNTRPRETFFRDYGATEKIKRHD